MTLLRSCLSQRLPLIERTLWNFTTLGAALTVCCALSTVLEAGTYNPLVRVSLTNEPVKSATIEIDANWRVQPVGNSQVLLRGKKTGSLRISATSTGFQLGSTSVPVSRLEILPDTSPAIWVNQHQYRGTLRLYRLSGGSFLLVNALPLESYLASVVDGEMPIAFGNEARQAQAIVARTYALYHMQRMHPHFDVYASTKSQKYLGFQYRSQGRRLAGESDNSRKIVNATAGIVCTWKGKLFCTYYSAVCGGQSLDGKLVFTDAAPPVKSVKCQWCEPAKLYRWEQQSPIAQVTARLQNHYRNQSQPFRTLKKITRSGRDWIFSDGSHSYRMTPEEVRRIVFPGQLYSPQFSLKLVTRPNGSSVVEIEGQGHGHGVGLCQWGASGLDLKGKYTALDIVRYYYPGVDLVVLRDGQ